MLFWSLPRQRDVMPYRSPGCADVLRGLRAHVTNFSYMTLMDKSAVKHNMLKSVLERSCVLCVRGNTVRFVCPPDDKHPCAHHQEVKIALYSIWYHHTCRWPSGAQVERGLCTGRPPTECDDTRCCIIKCCPPDDEHMVLETCRGI